MIKYFYFSTLSFGSWRRMAAAKKMVFPLELVEHRWDSCSYPNFLPHPAPPFLLHALPVDVVADEVLLVVVVAVVVVILVGIAPALPPIDSDIELDGTPIDVEAVDGGGQGGS